MALLSFDLSSCDCEGEGKGKGELAGQRDRPTRVKQAKIVVNMNYLQATCAACNGCDSRCKCDATRRMRNVKTDATATATAALALALSSAHYECERTRKAAQKRMDCG